MDAFRFPFRFHKGQPVKIDQQSEEFYAQCIMHTIRTERGVLPINPFYGTTPPEFVGFDEGGFLLNCSSFYPDFDITGVQVIDDNSGQVNISVSFKPVENI